jgi:hypothetical protein
MSKVFIIALLLALAVGYGTHNWNNAFIILIVYIIGRIIFNVFSN